jgi:hypothetical protein
MVLDGEATEEGAYAFFHALRGAMDRFPQLLQSYVGLPGREGEDWSQVAARLLWRDTLESPTALRLSQFFYEVWLGGKVQGVYWGRQGGHLRRFLPFVGQDSLAVWESYPWPEAPLSAQALPAQGAMVFYTRWGVPTRSWASLLALWAHLKGLEAYLCEEKQLVCQFFLESDAAGDGSVDLHEFAVCDGAGAIGFFGAQWGGGYVGGYGAVSGVAAGRGCAAAAGSVALSLALRQV